MVTDFTLEFCVFLGMKRAPRAEGVLTLFGDLAGCRAGSVGCEGGGGFRAGAVAAATCNSTAAAGAALFEPDTAVLKARHPN